MTDELSRSFGFSEVSRQERESRIRAVFQAVAGRYDLMNDVMSMGVHRLWKRDLARRARPRSGEFIVDVAGGTGDIARLMAAHDRLVVVCDPSTAMMEVGRSRCPESVRFTEGTAEAMPFPDGSVDLVTIAFGLRNTTDPDQALAEIFRVLKPGGRFLCLEFSSAWPIIRPFYDAWSFHVIPRLGAWVAREPAAYEYLVESIRRFPERDELAGKMRHAGFAEVAWRDYTFGIACLHQGIKP